MRAWEEEVHIGLTDEEIEKLDDDEFWSLEDVIEHYELERDGVVVRFSPWSGDEQAMLLELYEEHGDKLVAVFKDSDFSKFEVLVKED